MRGAFESDIDLFWASNMSDWVCDTDSKPAMRIVEQFRGMMDQSPPVTNSDSPTSSLDEGFQECKCNF